MYGPSKKPAPQSQAAHAPTAANLQPVRLIAVQGREGLAKTGKGVNLYGATLAAIVCADHGKAWVRPFDKNQTTDIDASLESFPFVPEKWPFRSLRPKNGKFLPI